MTRDAVILSRIPFGFVITFTSASRPSPSAWRLQVKSMHSHRVRALLAPHGDYANQLQLQKRASPRLGKRGPRQLPLAVAAHCALVGGVFLAVFLR
ncbi:hypothetical protein [Variovorax saccharolyticus]|uniref:hypothetical protein n=1 Tax=Variovorax saccharolyticus TaxID=3053516 RepID=UPI00257505AD|nr:MULTISPECIES: hypothetical protein [unclassified Variovorax]MDM0022339.1 hypothetical protein [Variovorax sp. J22R187]MDM0028895.1 hypothetical protein [Variovorax sp. J31P216]